jgi:HK97 family phage prohead protease
VTAILDAPPTTGVMEVLAAVIGVVDEVGDVIVPGAFADTLATRRPKVCLGHDWNRPIGKVLDIVELLPGDSRLPKTTAEGKAAAA